MRERIDVKDERAVVVPGESTEASAPAAATANR
jgi:hypothetical protein